VVTLCKPGSSPHSQTPRMSKSGGRYNDVHTRARSVVERTIGQLKGRWRCLDKTGGMLLYSPQKACRIVLACSVLHNVANTRGVPPPQVEADMDEPDPGPPNIRPNAAALQLRLEVIQSM